MKRKIIALGLVLSMALSLTACGNSFNKHTKKISKILSDLGYEEEDEDYLLDTMDEDGDSDEDGFYASSTNKKAFKHLLEDSFEDVSAKDLTNLFVGNREIDGDSENAFVVYVVELVDEDAASDFYDEAVDSMDEMIDNFKDNFSSLKKEADEYAAESEDIDDNHYQCYLGLESEDYDVNMHMWADIQIDGNTVIVVTGIVSSSGKDGKKITSDVEDFFDAYGVDNPSELA